VGKPFPRKLNARRGFLSSSFLITLFFLCVPENDSPGGHQESPRRRAPVAPASHGVPPPGRLHPRLHAGGRLGPRPFPTAQGNLLPGGGVSHQLVPGHPAALTWRSPHWLDLSMIEGGGGPGQLLQWERRPNLPKGVRCARRWMGRRRHAAVLCLRPGGGGAPRAPPRCCPRNG